MNKTQAIIFDMDGVLIDPKNFTPMQSESRFAWQELR